MTDKLTPDYQIPINKMVLHICKVQVSPAVIYAQIHKLESTNAKYSYITEVKMSAISKGQVNFTMDNVCREKKPNKMVKDFVESGTIKRRPGPSGIPSDRIDRVCG